MTYHADCAPPFFVAVLDYGRNERWERTTWLDREPAALVTPHSCVAWLEIPRRALFELAWIHPQAVAPTMPPPPPA